MLADFVGRMLGGAGGEAAQMEAQQQLLLQQLLQQQQFEQQMLQQQQQQLQLQQATSGLPPGGQQEQAQAQAEPCTGKVKSFNSQKGWGFIESDGVEGDSYFQTRDLPTEYQQEGLKSHLVVGKTVIFTPNIAKDGKPQARNVSIIPDADETPGVAGTVKSYNEAKGWGFIATDQEIDVYFQRRDLPLHFQQDASQVVGQICTFSLKVAPDGKPQARMMIMADQAGSMGVSQSNPYAQKGKGGKDGKGKGKDAGYDIIGGKGGKDAGYDIIGGKGGKDASYDIIGGKGGKDAAYASYEQQYGADYELMCQLLQAEPPQDLAEDDNKLVGCVKAYNASKGWGFISCDTVGKDVYFQRRDVPAPIQEDPAQVVGATVRFSLKMAPDGSPQAFAVDFSSNKRAQGAVGGMAVHQMAKRQKINHDEGGRMSGYVKSYASAKGWGFITSEQLGGDVYFQRRDMIGSLTLLGHHEDEIQGWFVTFDVIMTPDGKPQAKHLEFSDGASMVQMQPQMFGGTKGTGPLQKGEIIGAPTKGGSKGKFDCMAGFKGYGKAGFKGGCKGEGGGFKGGASKGGKCKGPGDFKGVIKNYHPSGYGFINNCDDAPGDIYFQRRDVPFELQEQPELMVPGRSVTFHIKHSPDGKAQAFGVLFDEQEAAWAASVAVTPNSAADASFDNAQFAGVINGFDASTGIGSIASEEIPAEVSFQRRDLPPAIRWDESKVMGQQVEFGITLSDDGSAQAVSMKVQRSTTATQPAGDLMDEMVTALNL